MEIPDFDLSNVLPKAGSERVIVSNGTVSESRM